MFEIADPGGQSEAVVVRPLAGRDSGFESRRGHGCLSLVNVMYCTRRSICDGPNSRPEIPVEFVTECDHVQQ